MMRALLILMLSATIARGDSEAPGDFDYYVLALSWTPTWCALTGDARDAPECSAAADAGWSLHGLWPQYTRGWPSYCSTDARPPTRALSRGMADIMGSAGLARYQWKKHGSCTGLSARRYYALARKAFESVTRPAVFAKLTQPVTLPASVVEDAFRKANPGLERDMVTITCRDGRIREARICLSRDLAPVPCGPDVVHDCRLKDALLDPVR